MGIAQGPLWREWMRRAQDDLEVAELLRKEHAGASVLHSQQAAEKAAKGLWLQLRHTEPPRVHAVGRLLQELGAPAKLAEWGTELAEAYGVSRYPDAEPQPPRTALDEADAEECLGYAREIVLWVRAELPEE